MEPLQQHPNVGRFPLTIREVLEEELLQIHGTLGSYAKLKEEELKRAGAVDGAGRPTSATDQRLLAHLYREIHDRAQRERAESRQDPSTERRANTSKPNLSAGSYANANYAPLTALCLSGGGIRSATYGLGVLQGLASWGLLKRFDYLSTVSGGGYIGSWLTAWIHREPGGIETVNAKLSQGIGSPKASPITPGQSVVDSEPCADGEVAGPGSAEAGPVRYLRRFSNYLTPQLGISSGDAWALAAIYVRNLILNWLVLVPLLVAVLLVPRLYLTIVSQAGPSTWWFAGFPRAIVGGRLIQTPLSFDWLRIATSVLSLVPLTLVVVWLPSVRRREFGPDENPVSWRGVAIGIVALITISCAVSTVDFAWRAIRLHLYTLTFPDMHIVLHRKWWDQWAVPLGLYSAAAVFIRISTRKTGSRPRFIRLLVCYLAMGVLAVFLMSLVRALPFISDPVANPRSFVILYPPSLLAVYLLTLTLYVGLTSRGMRPDDDDDREWLARLMGYVMFVSLTWILLGGIALWGPQIVHQCFGFDSSLKGITSVLSVVSLALGLFGGRAESSGAREGARKEGLIAALFDRVPDVAARIAVLAIMLLLSAGINEVLVGISAKYSGPLGTEGQIATRPEVPKDTAGGNLVVTTEHTGTTPKLANDVAGGKRVVSNGQATGTPGVAKDAIGPKQADLIRPVLRCVDCSGPLAINLFPTPQPIEAIGERDKNGLRFVWPGSGWACVARLSIVVLLLLATVILLGLFMNFNRLSMHSTYRNRLMRAYLGASNPDRDGTITSGRDELFRGTDPFTGFDPNDNVPMHHLRRGAFFTDRELEHSEGGTAIWVKLARYWLDDTREDEGLRNFCWQGLTSQNREKIRATIPQAGPVDTTPSALEVREIIKARANQLLCDPSLIRYSAFRALCGSAKQREALLDSYRDPAAVVEIDRAYRHLLVDGCPLLLNRLILENECSLSSHQGAQTIRDYFFKPIAYPPKPFHVINTALNLVAGKNLAWQQRKAASFVMTPLHCGFYRGYRSTVEYGGGITLGTAMTISGAAATPNMGYHSSPAVTFLMALFNARLGWWLGNPADLQRHTFLNRLGWFMDVLTAPSYVHVRSIKESSGQSYHLPSPRHSLQPLLDEALGRTSDENRYIYLSDGGHFENLGLYEMLRRRCRFIVVIDASYDPKCTLESLGNAIRKVGIDFGISIVVDGISSYSEEQISQHAKYCAVGTIRYSDVDGSDGRGEPVGTLIFIKPGRHTGDPADVYNYRTTRRLFPHESTVHQWFSESQFESYRRLGKSTIDEICGIGRNEREQQDRPREISIEQFAEAARRHFESRTKEDSGTAAGAADGAAMTEKTPAGEERMSGKAGRGRYDGFQEQRIEFDQSIGIGRGQFRKEDISMSPDTAGIFWLYGDDAELIYVGTGLPPSGSIRGELLRRLDAGGLLAKAAETFQFLITADAADREREILEKYRQAHAGALPLFNR